MCMLLVARQQLLNHPPEDYAATFDKERHHGDDTVSLNCVCMLLRHSRTIIIHVHVHMYIYI